MIALSELLQIPVEEVLKTPSLRDAVKTYCSQLFYNGNLVRTCDSSIKLYHRKLQLEGMKKLEQIENKKYQLLPGLVITWSGQVYNQVTITDEIAENYLEKFPKGIVNFKPVKEIPKTEKVETAKEKQIKKALDLGVGNPEKLSAKKLKDAIAEKEIELQKK
jgi:hypothetical protein